MSLAVAIQMDPIETVNIDADCTFVLALEAQRRGHALFHYLPRQLSFREQRVYAPARAAGSAARARQPLHAGRARRRSISPRSTWS